MERSEFDADLGGVHLPLKERLNDETGRCVGERPVRNRRRLALTFKTQY